MSRGVKSNPKTFFRYPKSKLNFKNAIPDLVDNGKILSDDNSKAKAFNMFFKSVFTEEYNYQIYGKHRNQAKSKSLGKSYRTVLRFHYTVDNNSKN